jgi:hypothetical protein
MPRVIINAASPSRRYDSLVQELARELASPGGKPQPLIVERHLPATNSRHVHVVWDEWGDLADEERSAVIIQAYAKVEGDEAASNITVALGLRPEDAITFGVLPFKVVPKRPQDADRNEYRNAQINEGANTVLGRGAKELRYASFEEAEQAVKRLKRLVLRSSWEIVRETKRNRDFSRSSGTPARQVRQRAGEIREVEPNS